MEGSDARLADLGRPAILLAHAPDFRRDFGKRAFPLMHNLANDPLFSLEALEDAAACWTKLGQSHRL